MFLDHLDDSQFDLAIYTCRSAARKQPFLPIEYRLPAIAMTIAQMVPAAVKAAPTAPVALPTSRVNQVDNDVSQNSKGSDDLHEPMCCRV